MTKCFYLPKKTDLWCALLTDYTYIRLGYNPGEKKTFSKASPLCFFHKSHPVCMYVCVYVCIYIYIYIYTHTYMHIYMHTHTGAGHIIRISSKSWFISLIPFKKWNLYNVYIHSTQTDIFQVFISFNFDDYNWQLMKTPNSVSQILNIEYCEKVQYWRHLVPHSNQLINSKHL